MKQAFYISPDGRQGRKGYYFYDSNNGFVIENGYSNSRVKSAGSAGDTAPHLWHRYEVYV